jgi:hypothetical protein
MTDRRRARLAGLLAPWLALGATPALAQAPVAPASGSETPAAAAISVGVYMPSVYFPDSLARARYAETLARGLEGALGQPVRGRAFGASGEFQAQVAAGGVDFAAVDAAYAIQHGGFEPLAQAQSGGNPARPLIVLASGGAGSVSALAGQPIVLFDVGANEDRFLSNFVFQGQVGPDYFKRAKPVRDAQAALSVVQLGKARVTLGYEGSGGGLSPVFTSRAAPLPVFVRVRAVEPGVAAAVKKAVVGLAAPTEAYDGFGPYNGGGAALSALRSAIGNAPGGANTEPVLASPAGNLPPPTSHLDPAVPPALVQEPPAADAIFVPAPPADAF